MLSVHKILPGKLLGPEQTALWNPGPLLIATHECSDQHLAPLPATSPHVLSWADPSIFDLQHNFCSQSYLLSRSYQPHHQHVPCGDQFSDGHMVQPSQTEPGRTLS